MEDTSNAIEQLGIALEQNEIILKEKESLKKEIFSQQELLIDSNKRNKNLYNYGNIMTPLLPISLIAIGGICIGNNQDELGKNLLLVGGITLVGFELVFQSGHWVFKFF